MGFFFLNSQFLTIFMKTLTYKEGVRSEPWWSLKFRAPQQFHLMKVSLKVYEIQFCYPNHQWDVNRKNTCVWLWIKGKYFCLHLNACKIYIPVALSTVLLACCFCRISLVFTAVDVFIEGGCGAIQQEDWEMCESTEGLHTCFLFCVGFEQNMCIGKVKDQPVVSGL